MEKFDSHPRKRRVLSFRVSETDWQNLQVASKEVGADISSLLRQSLQLLLKHRQD